MRLTIMDEADILFPLLKRLMIPSSNILWTSEFWVEQLPSDWYDRGKDFYLSLDS